MSKRQMLLTIVAGLSWAACEYPANPSACASNPQGTCGEGKYCHNDGRTSACLPLPSTSAECGSARWPDECFASRADAGADGAPPVDGPGQEVASPTDGAAGPEMSPGCTDRCKVGDKRCGDGGIEECIDDGCMIWGPATPCPAPTICQADGSNAICGCPEACTLGHTSCGERGVRDCIMQNGCRVWGPERTCPSFCKQSGSAASCCGDGVRGGEEKCDGGPSGSTELGSCNPECTGFYEKKTIRHTRESYVGDLGGPTGADQICRGKFGNSYKALLVGGGRRATMTPLQGDGQTDWVIRKYTHYFNDSGSLIWRTDDIALLGVRDGQRMNIYADAFPQDQTYPWGGYDSNWMTVPDEAYAGTCKGWTSASSSDYGNFPVRDLRMGASEPCSSGEPLLCVEQ